MWLINTETLKLEFFNSHESVRYAILSHTWEEGEEVSFQEFEDLYNARRKKGFHKIIKTCELALSRNLSWAWIDTCCIDKTSSAELSEAINLMFKYYSTSAVCFAYLSDISMPTERLAGEDADDEFETQLGISNWVKRGWTLQELIAPRSLEFFDSTWNRIGSKWLNMEQIATVTGIDYKVLAGAQRLGEVSIARRMSWAAKRMTTRLEDMAYCLFGIFDVNMPLLYGEGDKSFIRLQEEIAKETSDLSLFAWRHPKLFSGYFGVLATSPEFFKNSGNIRPCVRSNRPSYDFVSTTMGLRIMGYGFPLVPELKDDDADKGSPDSKRAFQNTSRIGVYLVKTPNGYVRARPAELYYKVDQEAFISDFLGKRESLLLRKKVKSEADSREIRTRFHNRVEVRSPLNTPPCRITPEALWVDSFQQFLDPGCGVNAFMQFDLRTLVPDYAQDCSYPIIVGLTTTNTLACGTWKPDDDDGKIINAFMDQEKDDPPPLSDFVEADEKSLMKLQLLEQR
ncbi:heterokaryon incompatibility protein-domain-containing protein [Xylariaceae sp. FL1272]|nr:heterokaryon incompatibility protein-domain-containing protein [Xylariaceae sp. FL1272]